MIIDRVQRWKDKRGTYRPAGEPIKTSDYEVASMPDDASAKAFVLRHHYSSSYPAARERFGLFRGPCRAWACEPMADLAGVAVFSIPANSKALNPAPGDDLSRVELGRFVLADDVPANGESWFLARCFELLRRKGYTGIVSFSDPEPRHAHDGSLVFRGHLGTIYQASNAVFLGRSKAGQIRLLPDGTVFHARAIAKIRKRDQGWRYSAALLEDHGAAVLGSTDDPVAWLEQWLPRLTKRMRHPGNLKYAWDLERRGRRARLPDSLPYPKIGLS